MKKFKVQSSKFKVLEIVFLLLISHFSLLTSCSPHKEKVYRKTVIHMDTLVTINVVSDSAEKAEKAMDKAFVVIDKLEKLLTYFSDQSELAMINRKAGVSPVKVSPETLEVIEEALNTSEETEGSFDVTIGPEISLWDFHKQKKPDYQTIKKKLELVNYKLAEIDKEETTVYLRRKGMIIDLGAIAKGYAADKAVEELMRQRIRSGLVSVAGDIRAFGLRPDGKPWRVGIRDPRPKNKDNEIMAIVDLTDMAISTSGDYERYFFSDGKRYHHILNPKTGYPAMECQGVTVIAKTGVQADSFSTGVFVLGPEKGMAVLKQMGFEGMIVDKDGKVTTTPGLRGRIEFKRNN
ncbi:MAG TPA: FAD:protein FMN transferase [Thermodesulfovibrionales bacterium]|nr:FAD:protein FMN transferase [Thermodesulfovibrionales bacterium]